MKLKQIVLSIENSPDRLYQVADALGEAGINLRAINLVDTGELGRLKLLVSDLTKARRILMELQMPAFINEVVAAEIPDVPRSLAAVLKPLNDKGIYPTSMYAFHASTQGKVVMIFRFNDNDKAVEMLEQMGVRLLDSEAFGMLESAN